MTRDYDERIRLAAEEYLAGWDWRIYRAVLMAESALNPDARSPAGARGIAQFMPRTWLETMDRMNLVGDPEDPTLAIPAGAYYLHRQWRIWTAPRPVIDRQSLAMASYNAGAGNIIKAQRVAGGPNGYAEIIAALPQVTHEHARETISYVRRIWHYYIDQLTQGDV